MSLYSILWM